jgi:hypothetical protein
MNVLAKMFLRCKESVMLLEADASSDCFGGGPSLERQQRPIFALSALIGVAEDLRIAIQREGISWQREAQIVGV